MKKKWMRLECALRCAVAAVCAAFVGCDVDIPSLRKATERVAEYSAEHSPKEPPSPSQIDCERSSLEHYAAGCRTVLESELSRTEKELSEIRADRRSLSRRIAEISDKAYADGKSGLENVLLLLLRDETVNSMAAKYLGGDFSIARSDFVAKVREACRQKKEREDALAEGRKIYEEAVTAFAGRDAMAKKSGEDEKRRMQSAIRDKERRIGYLRNMGMASPQEKERRCREIASLETEVKNIRRGLEQIRANAGKSSSDSERKRALRQLEDSGKAVERRFRGALSVYEVADECEKLTVKKLDACMREKESAAFARKDLQEARIVFVSSIASGLEKLDAKSLDKVREEIGRALQWTFEDARGKGFHVGR